VTVNTTNEDPTLNVAGDGTCTLREALGYALGLKLNGSNHDCGVTATGTTTIKLPLFATHYQLAAGLGTGLEAAPPGAGPVVIVGEGTAPARTTIDAARNDRVFHIPPGANVTLRNLTVTGGGGTIPFQDGGAGGAGILNEGTLLLDHVIVTGNAAQLNGRGGGIENVDTLAPGSGVLTLVNSTVSNNSAGTGVIGSDGTSGPGRNHCDVGGGPGVKGGDGGGIYNYLGQVAVIRTTITANTAGTGGNGGGGENSTEGDPCTDGGPGGKGGPGGSGGAIFNNGGKVAVRQSAISGNRAGAGGNGGQGGLGIPDAGGNGGNAGAGGDGGGIDTTNNGVLSVSDTTIALNGAGNGGASGIGGFCNNPGGFCTGGADGLGGPGGRGGAILQQGGYATTTEATISLNHPGQAGTGSPNRGPGSGSGIDVLFGEFLETDTIVSHNDCSGPVEDGAHNLLFAGSGCPGAIGDPLLAPLQHNGGPTETMALRPGSPAIDQVPKTGAGCTPTDQRGVPRPQGPACDIGAYEFP
jgi:hypothetical protein